MCVCIYIYSPCLILFFVFFALSCFVHFYLLQLKRVSLTTDKHLDLGSRSAVVVSHFSSTDGLIGWCHYLACASNVFRDMMISFWQFFHCLTLPRPGAVWRLSSLFSLTLWRLGRPRYLLYFFFCFVLFLFFQSVASILLMNLWPAHHVRSIYRTSRCVVLFQHSHVRCYLPYQITPYLLQPQQL